MLSRTQVYRANERGSRIRSATTQGTVLRFDARSVDSKSTCRRLRSHEGKGASPVFAEGKDISRWRRRCEAASQICPGSRRAHPYELSEMELGSKTSGTSGHWRGDEQGASRSPRGHNSTVVYFSPAGTERCHPAQFNTHCTTRKGFVLQAVIHNECTNKEIPESIAAESHAFL